MWMSFMLDEEKIEELVAAEPTMAPPERRDWQAKMFLNDGERLIYRIVSKSFLKHTFFHSYCIRLLERRHHEVANFLLTPIEVPEER